VRIAERLVAATLRFMTNAIGIEIDQRASSNATAT
jgi:hypothetical protein